MPQTPSQEQWAHSDMACSLP